MTIRDAVFMAIGGGIVFVSLLCLAWFIGRRELRNERAARTVERARRKLEVVK